MVPSRVTWSPPCCLAMLAVVVGDAARELTVELGCEILGRFADIKGSSETAFCGWLGVLVEELVMVCGWFKAVQSGKGNAGEKESSLWSGKKKKSI